ncbi:hypothetical protein GPECTOR_82g239 [Gonium pectorale]|uniref:Protein kinase domain-containing protein n=1 Tax=Gonium pectorale TaxID=33097 RepID=A0A150G2G9_GONPE|nr:hypothetical protein GPECTOR_82g239 [Gonium pectorale]|eukprot:KXZ43705.1 hypothetical protein GPECTOR_82g239 [Gonium pectorale]
MVTKARAAAAVRAAAHSSQERGELLSLLDSLADQELAQWLIVDQDDDETIRAFIRAKAQGAAAGPSSENTAAGGVDNSEEYAKQLLQPPLDSPPHLDDLQRFIREPPAAQIPIIADALDGITLSPRLKPHFTVASGQLARSVGLSLMSPLTLGDSEVWTSIAEHLVVVSLLLALDKALPSDLRIGLVAERDQRDNTSLMTVKSLGGSSLRPDGVLRGNSGRRLLAKWEDKAASMEQAVEDLRKKTAAWTQLYYGDIEYLPCFAAAGSNLQFYAISRASGMATAPRAISPRYDLNNTADRVEAVMATVKFYQLLCAQQTRYPVDVLPAGAVMRAHGQGFTRELLFRTDVLEIRKRVSPWSTFASLCGVDFTRLEQLYRATTQRQGLVHAVKGAPTLQGSVYSVDLIPVGLPSSNTLPATEDDAQRLLHGLLHGLAAIHEAGFVHRDLRWDNFACSPGSPGSRRWFLLDLETCAPADQPPPPAFQPVGWQPGTTLVGGRYTRASDLYQLGLAVQPNCEQLVVSPEGRAFMEAILTPPVMQERSAELLLAHEWLRCEGASICRAAGAQPGER